MLRVDLQYTGKREPVLTGIRRISKPGLRVYTKATAIPRVYGGLGIAVISTPKGVMSGKQARRLNLGGEVICHVW
jgi:small subunit ribosomal protein S8